MACTGRQIFRIFSAKDTAVAEEKMPLRLKEAWEQWGKASIGRLPTHGAELKGEIVETCPGSERLNLTIGEGDNFTVCRVCSVEFPVVPQRCKV